MATLVRDKMTTALICALALGAARAADPVVGLAREEGYEAEVKEIAPPRFGTERGVRVAVQLSLSQLSDVNVARQEVEFYSWWRHSWRDPRLQWDPDDWGGVAELSFVGRGEHQEAWMPDDLVYEATSSVYQLPEILVNAYASGSVFVSHPVHQIVPCPMDLQHFPFDEQECEFTYRSWMNHGWLVDTQPCGSEDDGWAAFVFGELFEANTEYDLVEVRRHARTYVSGILLPMVLATYAGFLAFAANPDSGERIGLGITAAIYIVAFEVLPKSSEDTAITMIHIISFIFSLATLAVSVVSVSLYSVKTSTGVMSEREPLMAFVRADGDHSGSLDKDEIEQAVAKLGLPPVVNERLRAALDEVDAAITLPIWYDMVGELYKTDGVAAFHSPIIGCFLRPFLRWERRARKQIVLRRMAAAARDGRISKRVLESTRQHQLARRDSTKLSGLRGSFSRAGPSLSRAAIVEELPELPSDGSAASPARTGAAGDDKGALEAIITQYELSDPSSVIARKIAGYLDMFGSILLPVLYTALIIAVLASYGNVLDTTAVGDFDGTRITHAFNGTTESSCCCGD
ncbi:neuronal acetylcholine receptor subunit alpha-10 [Aureococcus anophagefferens]|nr:neuronal acetylcholine receptor subunit alpha-10 [Aureococcus anophagefferens]